MTACFVRLKCKRTWIWRALFIANAAAVIAMGDVANAASGPTERSVMSVERPQDEPIMAIVSLRNQRITVYDANGSILQAPVSSGQKGRETPAGIFSVIQKEAEHYSNLYDDAYMPHTQRLTWSGIALHGCIKSGLRLSRNSLAGTRFVSQNRPIPRQSDHRSFRFLSSWKGLSWRSESRGGRLGEA
jgi:hypothetical protein